MIRKIVYPIAAVIITLLIFFLISMTLPSDWSVQRRIYINEKPPAIAPYIQDMEKWKEWNKWAARRGINSIALTCRLPAKTTCVVTMEGHSEIEECLTMLVEGGTGTYVVEKVTGKIHANPVKRFFVSYHDDALGAELEASLRQLKKMVEKK